MREVPLLSIFANKETGVQSYVALTNKNEFPDVKC